MSAPVGRASVPAEVRPGGHGAAPPVRPFRDGPEELVWPGSPRRETDGNLSSWPRPIVPALLALAHRPSSAPGTDGGTSSRDRPWASPPPAVLAAFGLTCWELGKTAAGAKRPQPVPDPSMPPVSPIGRARLYAEAGGAPEVILRLSAGASPSRAPRERRTGRRISPDLLDRPRPDCRGPGIPPDPCSEPVATDVLATIADVRSRAVAGCRPILSWRSIPTTPDAAHYAEQIASAKGAAASKPPRRAGGGQGGQRPGCGFSWRSTSDLAAVLTAESARGGRGPGRQMVTGSSVMRRLRGGTVRPDVAELAAKVADRLPEGASKGRASGRLSARSGGVPGSAPGARARTAVSPTPVPFASPGLRSPRRWPSQSRRDRPGTILRSRTKRRWSLPRQRSRSTRSS